MLLKQTKTVWVVAFACVISFMGIGLVDPILKPIADSMDATPSQVSLLFTSYFAVTGIAMLATGWVSSRIGAKRTLLLGVALVIVGSALAGAQSSIEGIVAFRGVWGLGNALFISTALATIVSAAGGSVGQAIILYEAALGLGIAVGPLVGGVLGSIGWRYPFFGVAALMLVALVGIYVALPRTPKPTQRTSLADPLRALAHPGLLSVAVTALLYNFGFFTLLAFTPFPMQMNAFGVGWVFFGWGVLLADHVGLRRAVAAAPGWHGPRHHRRAGHVRAHPHGDGHLHRQPGGPRRLRDRGRRLPRDQQHPRHRDRHEGLSGSARSGLIGIQLRALRRWGCRSLGRGHARRTRLDPRAVLARRRVGRCSGGAPGDDPRPRRAHRRRARAQRRGGPAGHRRRRLTLLDRSGA